MADIDGRIGCFGFCFQDNVKRGLMQEFWTLEIDEECVSGEYKAPSGEISTFSYRLDEIRDLRVDLFADRRRRMPCPSHSPDSICT